MILNTNEVYEYFSAMKVEATMMPALNINVEGHHEVQFLGLNEQMTGLVAKVKIVRKKVKLKSPEPSISRNAF